MLGVGMPATCLDAAVVEAVVHKRKRQVLRLLPTQLHSARKKHSEQPDSARTKGKSSDHGAHAQPYPHTPRLAASYA